MTLEVGFFSLMNLMEKPKATDAFTQKHANMESCKVVISYSFCKRIYNMDSLADPAVSCRLQSVTMNVIILIDIIISAKCRRHSLFCHIVILFVLFIDKISRMLNKDLRF